MCPKRPEKPAFGLTSTTVDDQLRLLRQITVTPSVLTTAQDYIQHLMGDVESDQQWGVPAAADSGTAYLVKNGWLPNPALWSINSIGEIDLNMRAPWNSGDIRYF